VALPGAVQTERKLDLGLACIPLYVGSTHNQAGANSNLGLLAGKKRDPQGMHKLQRYNEDWS
jgi:hypothetical protein